MNYRVKLLVVGESRIGKTQLINRMINQPFQHNQLYNIEPDFLKVTNKIEDENVQIIFWDGSGFERFRQISINFIKAANGILLVFNLNDSSSLEKIEFWYNEIKTNTNGFTNGFPVLYLVGNKNDLIQKCSEREIIKVMSKINKTPIYYCSAFNENGCERILNNISFGMVERKINEIRLCTSLNQNSEIGKLCLIE